MGSLSETRAVLTFHRKGLHAIRGAPDFLLLKNGSGKIVVEIKIEGERLSVEQEEWFTFLTRYHVPCRVVFISETEKGYRFRSLTFQAYLKDRRRQRRKPIQLDNRRELLFQIKDKRRQKEPELPKGFTESEPENGLLNLAKELFPDEDTKTVIVNTKRR